MYRFLLITEGRYILNEDKFLEASSKEKLIKKLHSYKRYLINVRDSNGQSINLLDNLELVEIVEVKDNV
jgi:hypothetical protein